MASVKSSFDEVKAAYQKMRTNLLIVLLIILAALIVGWFSPRLSLIPTAAAAVVWLKVYRPGVKAYASLATEKNLGQTVGKRLYNATITEKGGSSLTAAMVRNAELLPIVEKAEVLCFWQVAGSRRRIPVVTSDATAPLSLSRPDGKKSGTYLSGAWTRAELPKDTGADLRFIDRGAGVAGDTWYEEQGLQEIASESCPDAFLMLGRESGEDDSKPADGSVPKGFYEALQVLKEKTEGDVLVSLRGKELNVFIGNRFITYRIRTNRPPQEGQISYDPFPEYDQVLALAEAAAGEKTAK